MKHQLKLTQQKKQLMKHQLQLLLYLLFLVQKQQLKSGLLKKSQVDHTQLITQQVVTTVVTN